MQQETLRKWDFGILEFRCQTLVGMTHTVLSFFLHSPLNFSTLPPTVCFSQYLHILSPSPFYVIAAFEILLVFLQYI